MKILVLAKNQLTSIPANVKLLQQLNGLVLDKNPKIEFESLVENLSQLPNLKVLLLRKNQLTNLPKDLKGLSNLAVLELSGNNFSETEQARIKSLLPNTNVVF